MEILVTVSVVVTVAPGRRREERPPAGGVEDSLGAEKVAVRVVTNVVEGLVIVLMAVKSDSVFCGSDEAGMAGLEAGVGEEVVVGLGLGTVMVAVRVMVEGGADGGAWLVGKGSDGENGTTVVTVSVAVPVVSVTDKVFVNLPARLVVVGAGMVTFSPKILRAVFSSRHFRPTPSVTFMGTAKQPVAGAQGWMSKDPLVPQTPMLPETHAAWFLTHGESAVRSA